jgi:alpha-beta hydrolase superfamily lysophospholipase
VPVLAHIGGDERLVSADYQTWALSLLPDADVITYDGARHELMLELPDVRQAFWENTLAFLDRYR